MHGDQRWWFCRILRTRASLLVLVSAGIAASAAAAPISICDRGPCPDAADGVCVPNRKNFGFYSTRWRPWPGDRPAAVDAERPQTPQTVPSDVPPFSLPRPEVEDEFGRPAGPPVGKTPAMPGEMPGDAAQKGAAPSTPLRPSEDAPPPPPPHLREGSPTPPPAGGSPQVPLPTTPRGSVGAGSPPLSSIAPATSGQPSTGLSWKHVSPPELAPTQTPAVSPSPSEGAAAHESWNPLRVPSHSTGRTPPAGEDVERVAAARQVAYTVPPSVQPARPVGQERRRANPLRPGP